MVYADRQRVDCFTLDPVAGEFFLSRAQLKYPKQTAILSVNECNEPYWDPWVKNVLNDFKSRNSSQRIITSRHVGSLVADFHRNLIKGGLFLYPTDRNNGAGKLRLLYECNPLAFIAKTAGGSDSMGTGSVLDIKPTMLHQRSGFFVGPQEGVKIIERYFRDQ